MSILHTVPVRSNLASVAVKCAGRGALHGSKERRAQKEALQAHDELLTQDGSEYIEG